MTSATRWMRFGRRLVVAVCVALTVGGLSVSVASAEPAGPAWEVRSVAYPSNFSRADSDVCEPEPPHRGVCDTYVIVVTNVGSVQSTGLVTVRDRLPRGVVLAAAFPPQFCSGSVGGSTMTCVEGEVAPGASFNVVAEVRVTPEAAGSVTNFAEVEGGGAAPAVTGSPTSVANTVNSAAAPVFGIQDFGVGVFGAGGGPFAQAGGHPSLLSTTVNYTTLINTVLARSELSFPAVAEPRSAVVDLPLGLVGDPLAAEVCSEALLRSTEVIAGRCPAGSVVGEAEIERGPAELASALIYNVVPEPGGPALFGFEYKGEIFYLRPRVLPSSGGYVLSVSVADETRSQTVKITGAIITFFGDPTAHDGVGNGQAFFTDPVGCGSGPLMARLEMDSWVDPTRWVSAEAPVFQGGVGQGVTGCGALVFEPSLEVAPEAEESTVDTPAGYEVALRVPQTLNVMGSLATPDLRDAVVSFPAGVSVSPSAANGLVACQASGPEGIELGDGDSVEADRLASEHGVRIGEVVQEGEVVGEDGLVHASAGHCPLASQIGEVEVTTPLLKEKLEGHVYVAEPSCGGAGQPACTEASAADGELFGVYLEVEGSGVIVKLHGKALVNPQTGQVTTSFTEAPELPFSELKLKLNGGPRAPLANPQSCGVFVATSDLTPWSAPITPDATPSGRPFTLEGCGGAGGFSPSFLAGSVDTAAGVFSPFSLTFGRRDGEQDLSGVSVGMPLGLLARIAGVVRCGEVQANAGSCPAGSRVGTATAAAGAGSAPFWQSGSVFLTGPYGGAPFGLSVVVPAKAGPYNLGDIVVRAAIFIDPSTAAVRVVSNPLPQMVDGVPLRVQTVNVVVGEGGGFTFNPTDCDSQRVSGTISSAQGASVGVSSPFAVTGCANLGFKPSVVASVVGKASKADGASLALKVSLPAAVAGSGQVGGGANVGSFKLEFPKQLPSRNTTLQKACVAAVFEANPASCPAASDIGSVLVHTPVLSVALGGPMYLVSYGGEKFPQLVMILQGEGVTIDVTGTIHVSKQGITSVTLKTVPDAPFTSVEVKNPSGPFSILTANVAEKKEFDLCGQSLSMPTEIVGQNGVVVRQAVNVAVTGCPKSAPGRAQKLAKALVACKKKPKGAKRAGCEAVARKRYGVVKKASKSNRGAK
jgi:hypothetical protein